MELRFTVCWAIGAKGCPAFDFLVKLHQEDRDCFYAVVDSIEKIQDSRYLRPPTVKPLPVNKVKDLRELRVQGGNNKRYARIALMYTESREVILLNGDSKKGDRATKQFTDRAVKLRAQIRSKEIEHEPIPIEQIKQELEREG